MSVKHRCVHKPLTKEFYLEKIYFIHIGCCLSNFLCNIFSISSPYRWVFLNFLGVMLCMVKPDLKMLDFEVSEYSLFEKAWNSFSQVHIEVVFC